MDYVRGKKNMQTAVFRVTYCLFSPLRLTFSGKSPAPTPEDSVPSLVQYSTSEKNSTATLIFFAEISFCRKGQHEGSSPGSVMTGRDSLAAALLAQRYERVSWSLHQRHCQLSVRSRRSKVSVRTLTHGLAG